MTVAKQLQKCPFCLEPILAGATRCKHCQADLKAAKTGGKHFLSRYRTFKAGFLAGVLFSVILGLLIWAHLYWQ